jgi:hypothetical protein
MLTRASRHLMNAPQGGHGFSRAENSAQSWAFAPFASAAFWRKPLNLFLATGHQPLATSPLTPIIPALNPDSPVTPIIPALTQKGGWGAKTMPQHSSNTLNLSTHSVNVGAPTFPPGTPVSLPALGVLSPPPTLHTHPTPRHLEASATKGKCLEQ